MKIRTDEIASVIRTELEQYSNELEVSEVGRVVEVGDGIARVYGLANAMPQYRWWDGTCPLFISKISENIVD